MKMLRNSRVGQPTAPRFMVQARAWLAAFLILHNGALAVAQDLLPQGGRVVAGQASIGAASFGQLTVTQNSSRAVVDWNSFSVGAGNGVTFVQPNSSAAILNRVTGSTTSEIAGSITGNGQVFLVNPNGIAITKSGTVETGSFVASTLDTANADFMAGKLNFNGNGASASVSNDGRIQARRGGFAALLGGTVANSGTIVAPMGRVGLGSGEQATLDLEGDGFLQVAIPSQTARNGALIEQSGRIAADGGVSNCVPPRRGTRPAMSSTCRAPSRRVRSRGAMAPSSSMAARAAL